MTWSVLRKMSGCIIKCPCPLFWRKSRAAMHFRICWATRNLPGGAFKFRKWSLHLSAAFEGFCELGQLCHAECDGHVIGQQNAALEGCSHWTETGAVSPFRSCVWRWGGVRESLPAHLLLSLTCFWIYKHCYYTAAGLKNGSVIQSLSDRPFPSLCLVLIIFGF